MENLEDVQTLDISPMGVVVIMDALPTGVKKAHEFERLDSNKKQPTLVNNGSLEPNLWMENYRYLTKKVD